MDIDLAKTFITIAQTGSFVSAAEKLHVTQTTVTARIQNLEAQLECQLFVRNRSGAQLTENGRHFLLSAQQLVKIWEASKRDLPLPQEKKALISLGCEPSLWNPLMSDWVGAITKHSVDFAIRICVSDHLQLNEQLRSGVIDMAIAHQPFYSPNLHVEHILDEKLILVANRDKSDPYIFVDWGEDFRRQHDLAMPQYTQNELIFDLGPLALQYILQHGGRGYFRTRVASRFIKEGTLYRVNDSPEFSYPVYLIQCEEKSDFITVCASALKEVANRNLKEWL